MFYTYDGSSCDVFVDGSEEWGGYSNGSYSDGGYSDGEVAKIDVPVWYEPRDRGWYGFTVGNGPRGRISFSSLWE